MSKTRENWVDTVKIYACVLVVLGHFFQSMTDSGILADNHFLAWFDRTIYFYHVPLFFICSGFVFQKYSVVSSFLGWKNNFLKKLLSFGVPYFVFSIATWLLKTVFSSSVNTEVDGLFKSLFLKPIPPYWYLYALVIIFLFAFTLSSNRSAIIAIIAALVMKGISFIPGINVYALTTFLSNTVWFVIGMLLAFYNLPEKIKNIKRFWGIGVAIIFTALSVAVYVFFPYNAALSFAMGLIGSLATLLIIIAFAHCDMIKKITSLTVKYTFPVFLMHTIFAAGLRSVLLKIGVDNVFIHLFFGILISFIGPAVAAFIMSKIKFLEFLLYPTKFIKTGGRTNGKKA